MSDFQQYLNFNEEENKRRQLEVYTDTHISALAERRIASISAPQQWLVLGEPFCPDCRVFVPFVQKFAELNPNIKIKYVARKNYHERSQFDSDEQQKLVVETHNIPSLFRIEHDTTGLILKEFPEFFKQRAEQAPEQKDQLKADYRAGKFNKELERELVKLFTA